MSLTSARVKMNKEINYSINKDKVKTRNTRITDLFPDVGSLTCAHAMQPNRRLAIQAAS